MSARRPLTFAEWHDATPDLPGWARSGWFGYLDRASQEECWRSLRNEVDRQRESERLADEDLYREWPPPKRHQPAQRSTAATSTRPGAVALSTDDPLKNIEPRVYVQALTGVTVPASGFFNCPLPDHEDKTPSCQVLSSHWRCFGCGRGGSIIDLASAISGIEPRGQAYWRLRDWIVERLVWAPIDTKEGE